MEAVVAPPSASSAFFAAARHQTGGASVAPVEDALFSSSKTAELFWTDEPLCDQLFGGGFFGSGFIDSDSEGERRTRENPRKREADGMAPASKSSKFNREKTPSVWFI